MVPSEVFQSIELGSGSRASSDDMIHVLYRPSKGPISASESLTIDVRRG